MTINFISEVFKINPQIKFFKNCVFFSVLIPFGKSSGQAPETKNQEQTIPPHLQTCLAFAHSSHEFSEGFFLQKKKSSVFINISILLKLF